MSNDLISRKETERLLRAYADNVGCDRGQYELANGILKAVCYLDNIPTSYDLESVIGQLEELKESAKEKQTLARENHMGDMLAMYQCEEANFSTALEIIKSSTTATNGKNGG